MYSAWLLIKETGRHFMEDEALSRGAAIAYYTVFSIAPVLVIAIAMAGLAFGEQAAEGAIVDQLSDLIGTQGAQGLQAMIASASNPGSGILATVVGIGTLVVAATSVFGEMQSALNAIWKTEAPPHSTLTRMVRARLAGLGLVVTTDGGVPLVSHPYAGNRPDVTQFAQVVSELAARYGTIATERDRLTLVYDAGQDSAANQTLIEATPLHFVGSLRPSDHADLLAQPASRYKVVDAERFLGLSAFEAKTIALGKERRVVVTHSDELHNKQRQGFAQTMAKAHRQLSELAARLERGKTRRSKAAVEAEVTQITSPRWVSRCMTVTLRGNAASSLRLEFAVDREAQAALEAEVFGKRILFTDHEDWSIAEVVGAYRSQWQVEADFRQMKDPSVVSFSPMFHWTEQKIRVHVFYCVLALTVARLMVRQAARIGLHLSVREILSHLAGIEETVLLFANERGRPRARHMLTDMDPIQRRLYDLFELETYAPKR